MVVAKGVILVVGGLYLGPGNGVGAVFPFREEDVFVDVLEPVGLGVHEHLIGKVRYLQYIVGDVSFFKVMWFLVFYQLGYRSKALEIVQNERWVAALSAGPGPLDLEFFPFFPEGRVFLVLVFVQ